MADNNSDALAEMRERYDRAREYWDPVFDRAREDIKFVAVPGNQWPEDLRTRRGKNRHCYEFPKLRGQVQQIINEQKQTRPNIRIRGAEESDRGLADIMRGIIYNIASVSNADNARDIAYENAVRGGIGFYRVTTDYANQDDFNLDIQIRPIRNFCGAYCDPAAVEIDRRDALFWFVPESIPESEFERKYPGASLTDFYADVTCHSWRDAGRVMVAEYWYKKPYKKTILQLRNGEVVEDKDGIREQLAAEIIRERVIDCHKVYSVLTNGHEFLTEPVEFPCKHIPIIPVFGNIDCIDGEDEISGAVRFAKDAQRLHNVHRTAMIEAIAKAPKAPFVARRGDIGQFKSMWDNANSEDYPVLYVEDKAQIMPQRTSQAEVPVALIQAAQIDNEDMKAATGVPDAAMGLRSNEASGAAQRERKLQSATATYNYLDNLLKAMKFEAEILLELIPNIYDTPRVVRTLGPDGGEKWTQLYRQVVDPETGQEITLNDIGKGKYDAVIDIGPTYATQRMEAAEMYANMAGQLGSAMPPLTAFLAYMVAKNTDAPEMEEADAVMRKILMNAGVPLEPKDGDQPPPQPQPNPKDIASAEKDKAQAAKYQADTEAQQLANMENAARIGMQFGELGFEPMPMDPPQQQGGFGMPPGGPMPGSFTG